MEFRGIAVAGGLVALAVAADLALSGGGTLLYLARKLLDLVALLVFWR